MHQLPIQIGDDHCCYTITNQHVSRKVRPAELRSMAVQTTLVAIRCLNESLLSKADPFCASEGQWGRANTPRCAAKFLKTAARRQSTLRGIRDCRPEQLTRRGFLNDHRCIFRQEESARH